MNTSHQNGAKSLGASLTLRRAQCIPMLYARSGCRACEDACTIGALRRDGTSWELAPSCDNCGACVAACPTGAMDLRAPSTAELEGAVRRRLAASPGCDVPFACERSGPRGRHAIQLPCAARLDEATIVAALLGGARQTGVLLGDCRGCDRRERLGKVFGGVLRAARSVLDACGVEEGRLWAGRADRSPLAGGTRDAPRAPERREFLKRILKPGGATPVEDTLGRRQRLVDAVRPVQAALVRTPPGDLPLARVRVNSECLGCTVCEHVCAPGAITREETAAGVVTLRFDAGLCVACGACAEACMPDAIAIQTATDLDALASRPRETLATLAPRRCRACSESFCSDSAELCPRCRRFAGPSGFPPGVARMKAGPRCDPKGET